MERNQVHKILFFGAGEVAELAYLYLQLTKLELAGLVDDQKKGKNFFGVVIKGTESLHEMEWDLVMVTRLDDPEEAIQKLALADIDIHRIATI